MEKVWQLEDFLVESFLLLLLKPFSFQGNKLCSEKLFLKKLKVFQLQTEFMHIVYCHSRSSLKRESKLLSCNTCH